MTLLYLVAGTNGQGFCQALMKAWAAQSGGEAPVKSSLTKIRKRIRYEFFRKIFFRLIEDFEPNRIELRGFRLYAVDGEYLRLPCSKEILDQGYRGVCLNAAKETYYPHMYITHAYDILSQVTKDVRFNQKRQEIVDAIDMVASFEKNSISIYDRYYLSTKLVTAHKNAENYFLARCRCSGFGSVVAFFKSTKTRSSMVIDGVLVHLVKIKNRRTGDDVVIATNLPLGIFKKKEIAILYSRRWSIEGLFRDSTVTHLRLEQWHSKTENAILQELFTHYWLLNFSRIQIALETQFTPEHYLNARYRRPNFKWILEILIDRIPQLLKKELIRVLKEIRSALKRSMENRTHLARHYIRHIKTPEKRYLRAKAVPRRTPK